MHERPDPLPEHEGADVVELEAKVDDFVTPTPLVVVRQEA
jgi:hypothetical protein